MKLKHKSRLQLAEETMAEELKGPRRGHEAEDDMVAMLLRPLPDPPIFPASAAWEYLIAAQDRINGLPELQAAVKDIQGKIKVGFSFPGFIHSHDSIVYLLLLASLLCMPH